MSLSTSDSIYLKKLIVERSGNVVWSNQDYLLESRLTWVAKGAGLENVESLVAELQRNPWALLHDSVAEAMTINETSFFRDSHPFETLKSVVLPEIIQKRAATRTLSCWSAASSCGQEAYSIAMTIKENFPELDEWDIRIYATDLCASMVARTQAGVYSRFEVNRGLPAPYLAKHFDKRADGWHVNRDLKRRVEARQINLASAWPIPSPFDVVFLRNVLVYFEKDTRVKILNRIHKAMHPGGYLFLGGGETMINCHVPFVRDSTKNSVCFRPVLQ